VAGVKMFLDGPQAKPVIPCTWFSPGYPYEALYGQSYENLHQQKWRETAAGTGLAPGRGGAGFRH